MCLLTEQTRRTDRKLAQLEHVFIQGSKVRFMIIPDMLKNAPMFKRLEARIKGKGSSLGVGRGRAVAMRARWRQFRCLILESECKFAS
ncbi:putative like-Sm (LSM) domain containing protein, LSm4/SmD1/SmD3 [Helianthus debilis subsp. tardiflorus]